MNRVLQRLAFAAGLLAVCWIAAGYIGSNPIALAVTLLVLLFYMLGGLELLAFDRATGTLQRALGQAAAQAPQQLGEWLGTLHPSLRSPVRLRVEGERVALPGPALTPYLAGLLVLLGMLGTFLGMVVTLRGTGVALEHASDLDAIRAVLAEPVRGLGLAFGTSIAGVAGSAMLGLVASMCRRDRLLASQALDAQIAASLRPFSRARRREESLELMRRQGEALETLPALVQRLESAMGAMAQQHRATQEQQLASQERFQSQAGNAYTDLAAAVDQTLQRSLAEGARAAGAAMQPALEASSELLRRQGETLPALIERLDAAMTTIGAQQQRTHEQILASQERFQAQAGSAYTALAAAVDQTLRESLAEGARAAGAAVQPALDASAELLRSQGETLPALIERLDATRAAIDAQQRAAYEQAEVRQRETHEALAQTQRSLLASVEQHQLALQAASGAQLRDMREAIESHQGATQQQLVTSQEGFHARTEAAYNALAASVDQAVQRSLADSARTAGAVIEPAVQAAMGAMTREAEALRAQVEAGVQRQFQGLAEQAERTTGEVAARWNEALAEHARLLAEHARRTEQAAAEAQQALQARLAERDEARLSAWSQALQDMAGALQAQWQSAIAEGAQQHEAICDTLARTAADITRQAQDQSRDTLAEIGRLVEAASEAPRAAADVVAELRAKLSDSMVRDNAMLEERGRMLQTLQTLLDAVNHASSGQRDAIDALVTTSADLLERVGQRFAQDADAQSARLADVTAQVGAGAVEMASMGDAFGSAVQQFGQSNEKLATQLQRVETALGQSMARSDEQLAYYVAQAREVIDLSILSQRQIVEDLQHLAAQQQRMLATVTGDA